MKYFLIFLTIDTMALLTGCASFDVRNKVQPSVRAGGAGDGGAATVPAVIVVPVDEPAPAEIIERPVYIPQEAEEKTAPKPKGADAVKAAMSGILSPEDYSRAATVYDYDADWVYEAYCQPMRATDIRLKNNEKIAEAPFISDSERWKVGAGVSYENGEAVQHVYVKPDESGLEASLIINTDQRVYHLILRSYKTIHMPKVRWRYRENTMPYNIARGQERKAASGGVEAETEAGISADPRFLSFNYRVSYPLFGKPRWLPELAYDDGKKTYITFPDAALQTELPAVFENRDNVVNYRVARNVIIIDKLIEAVTVKIGTQQAVVRKLKGKT